MNGSVLVCRSAHTSDESTNKPLTGSSWSKYWGHFLVVDVADVTGSGKVGHWARGWCIDSIDNPGLWELADIAWRPESQSFWYRKSWSPGSYGTPTEVPAPTLNLVIAPIYAWLYLQTGDGTYRDWGDEIFAGGAKYGDLSFSKHFNQSYRWSFDYLKWRSEAEGRWGSVGARE